MTCQMVGTNQLLVFEGSNLVRSNFKPELRIITKEFAICYIIEAVFKNMFGLLYNELFDYHWCFSGIT